MVITGSALLVQPGSSQKVIESLEAFPAVTFHAESPAGTELVVNLEAENTNALEELCSSLKAAIPQIIDVAHISVNFEDEVERMISRRTVEGKDEP
jgi:nitrate reductase NapAB chaperone NapD